MGLKDQEEIIDAFLRLMPDRPRHEFGLWAAEQVRDLMLDDRSKKALDVKRLWLDGKATDEELEAARAAAWAAKAAAGDAAGDAAKAAAWAARDAARVAAWAAARDAARDAARAEAAARDAAKAAAWVARDAARVAAWAAKAAAGAAAWAAKAAAWDAAWEAARKLQADWILENYKDQLHRARVYEALAGREV